MRLVDAHAHYNGFCPELQAMFDELDLKALDVCVAHGQEDWRVRQAANYRRLAAESPRYHAWCTTFDLPDFADSDYSDRVIAGLKEDFAAGALACKLWKNIGMQVRDPEGAFIQMDHPIFDPMYGFLAEVGKPLLVHIAEPIGCWQPLTGENIHNSYYTNHPEWHMHNKPDHPSHGEIIAARDCVMARHPDLRLVGAHMGSQEHDLAVIDQMMDRFPNYTIDLSRVWDMTFLNPADVREFHLKHQDRIMFATDHGGRPDGRTPEELANWIGWMRESYLQQKSFYETGGDIMIGRKASVGIELPEDVVEKIYFRNAARIYPGLNP